MSSHDKERMISLQNINKFFVEMTVRAFMIATDKDLEDCHRLFPNEAHAIEIMVKALREDKGKNVSKPI